MTERVRSHLQTEYTVRKNGVPKSSFKSGLHGAVVGLTKLPVDTICAGR